MAGERQKLTIINSLLKTTQGAKVNKKQREVAKPKHVLPQSGQKKRAYKIENIKE